MKMKQLMILAVMMVMTISAKAISYEEAKDDALFLTDKMAYELSLTDEQYEAVYEINLDYLLCLNKSADLYGVYWERRNDDLRLVLSDWQYEKYLSIEYFYRPVKWESDAWVFLVYSHYARDLFYFTHPKVYGTYMGGNCFKSARFYADRIPNKPASPDHHHAPAPHGSAPSAPAPNNNAKPATPNNHPAAPASNNPAKPATPNTNAKPANPNTNTRPATPPNNGGARPAGNPGGAGGPGGGRPAGGGPGGGGPGGRR
jgi:hypothetical protein